MTLKIEKDKNELPCIINIEWDHNHPIDSLQVNSFKDISPKTAAKVRELFENGYSPGKIYI